MTTLKSLFFPEVIDTSSNDIIHEFFIPALSCSTLYDRGVGYFSAGWLQITAKGIVEFAKNSGRARWVTSPILSEDDWNSLQLGDNASRDLILKEALRKSIDELQFSLESETLTTLAWLIADNVLEFRLAVPRNKLNQGEFHDKFGVFTDEEGNKVSFNGSYNDSIKGTHNYESISIFTSWDAKLCTYVESDANRFERLWNDEDRNVQIYNLPDAAREQILKLRSDERPYPQPDLSKLKHLIAQENLRLSTGLSSIHMPDDLEIRDYQINAVDEWFKADCIGLFEMATGTGKTITSLVAALRLLEREQRLTLVIACPLQHLVDQWDKEASAFGFTAIKTYKSQALWLDKLNELILSYNHRDTNHVCIISTHDSLATEEFRSSIQRIRGPVMIIADEVHHLGAKYLRTYLPDVIRYRLALSATPDRWYDEEGTAAIHAYFGDTVFEFTLAQAIDENYLTPYYYYPRIVELEGDEYEEYQVLSEKIAKCIHMVEEEDDILGFLFRKRANLLNLARNKLAVLDSLLNELGNIDHALFYCAPKQIDDVVKMLGHEKRLLVHRFTAKEDTITRKLLLEKFKTGEYQALVAMRCLDEGVDVPSTKDAFILASSSNPREFIQRRGRILRKSPGKQYARIFDLITLPPSDSICNYTSERSILKRELARFKEFASSAMNAYSATDIIWDIAKQYDLIGL